LLVLLLLLLEILPDTTTKQKSDKQTDSWRCYIFCSDSILLAALSWSATVVRMDVRTFGPTSYGQHDGNRVNLAGFESLCPE
jgi:hypothetical protein